MHEDMGEMPDVDEIRKRTEAYRYKDGIGEIVYGFVLILIGLLNFVEAALTKQQMPSFGGTGFMILVAGGFMLGRWVISALKKRLVFPRTGYVEYVEPSGRSRGRRVAVAVIVAAVMGAVAAVIAARHLATSSGPTVFGDWSILVLALMVGAYLILLGFGVGLRRYCLLAGVSAVLGVAVLWAHLGVHLGSATYFAAMGLALAASGALALRAHLRKAPRPEGQ